MEEGRIVANVIQTPDGTILQSHNRHDYKTYEDKNGLEYMVDGGLDYLRRNIHKEHPYTELSLYEDSPWEDIRKYHSRGGRGKDGKQPLTWVPLAEMSDDWLKACVTYNEERGLGESFYTDLYRTEIKYRKENKITIED